MAELHPHIATLERDSRQRGTMLVFGYFHRTGPNIENKHHERLFFRWGADYNGPDANGGITERYERFLQDITPSLSIDTDVIKAAESSLQGYADRHAEAVHRDRATPRRLREQPEPRPLSRGAASALAQSFAR
ncbi:MAG: hypothetical protein M3361_19465 [Candidatus Tectomicrobia bacterium]|nr:hypothetical protein [Candidatus Tectomicrobia bacterium]